MSRKKPKLDVTIIKTYHQDEQDAQFVIDQLDNFDVISLESLLLDETCDMLEEMIRDGFLGKPNLDIHGRDAWEVLTFLKKYGGFQQPLFTALQETSKKIVFAEKYKEHQALRLANLLESPKKVSFHPYLTTPLEVLPQLWKGYNDYMEAEKTRDETIARLLKKKTPRRMAELYPELNGKIRYGVVIGNLHFPEKYYPGANVLECERRSLLENYVGTQIKRHIAQGNDSFSAYPLLFKKYLLSVLPALFNQQLTEESQLQLSNDILNLHPTSNEVIELSQQLQSLPNGIGYPSRFHGEYVKLFSGYLLSKGITRILEKDLIDFC